MSARDWIRALLGAAVLLVFSYVFIWLLWAAAGPTTPPRAPEAPVQLGGATCVQRDLSGAVIPCDAPVVTR